MEPLRKTMRLQPVTKTQLCLILDYMENHKDVFNGKLTPSFSARDKKRHWEHLAMILNARGNCSKSTEKWQRTWTDWKSSVRRKAETLRKGGNGTGEGTRGQSLTDTEERCLNLLKSTARSGIDRVNDPESSEDELVVERKFNFSEKELRTYSGQKSSVQSKAEALGSNENGTGGVIKAECLTDIEEEYDVNSIVPTAVNGIAGIDDPASSEEENGEKEAATLFTLQTIPTTSVKLNAPQPKRKKSKDKNFQKDTFLEDHLQLQREVLAKVNDLNKNIERNTEAQNSVASAINNMSRTINDMGVLLLAALERNNRQNKA